MITNQNKYNYNALFEKASKALGYEPADYIKSMNEYFSVIATLIATTDDLKYTILPLDEETFDIDANTRKIKVPPSFANGVGVQGDQAAEIIYFKIDRYFDSTDLNTQNIYIEWQNASKSDPPETGFSKEYVRDIESDPDHIIFGWPLTSEITEYPGLVKFAVRFYSIQKDEVTGEDKIVYSFATQPATILINQTMDFDLHDTSIQVLGDDTIEMIKNRFQNSVLDNSSSPLDPPIFTHNLVAGIYDINNDDGYDLDSNSYSLAVAAKAMSTQVNYFLRRAEPGSNNWDAGVKAVYDYFETTDVEYDGTKTYYVEEKVDGVTAYVPVESENQFNNYLGDVTMFEKYGIGKVTQPGDYIMQAEISKGAHSRATADSNVVTFPYPVKPQLEPGAGVELDETGNYAVVLDENGECDLVVAFKDNIRPTGALSYEWHDGTQTLDDPNQNGIYRVKTDKENGMYTVKVINERNRAKTDPVVMQFRVTKPAQTPEILYPTEQVMSSPGVPLTITVKTELVPYDSIKVQWFKTDHNTLDNLDDDIPQTDLLLLENSSFTPQQTGLYYAKVFLKRGASTAIAISKPYFIM